jgi:hypothetical protein
LETKLSRFDAFLENAKKNKAPKKNVKQSLKDFEAYKAQVAGKKAANKTAKTATQKQPKEQDFIK